MSIEIEKNVAPTLRRYPALMDRLMLFDGFAAHSAAVLRGYQDAADSAGEEYKDQKGRVDRMKAERAAGKPTAQTPETILAEDEAAQRLKATWDGLAANVKATIPIAQPDTAVKATAVRYTGRLVALDSDIKMVPVSLPKGDKTEALAKVQAEIAAKTKLKKTIKNAAIPEDVAVAKAIADLDEKVARAMPRLSFDPQRGVTTYWSFAALDDTDVARGVPNLEPLVMRLAYDEIVEHLKAETAKYYAEKVELALDSKTKKERLRTISAEMLALERVEVELIIALRKAGSLIAFRPTTDARALLGVDGPPPQSREDTSFMEAEDFADA